MTILYCLLFPYAGNTPSFIENTYINISANKNPGTADPIKENILII